jgi:hypothetical protein
MSDFDKHRASFGEAYREYARKMDLFMDGPTTTYFEQLTGAGIQLPAPESIADVDLRSKLWEVIAGLAALRVHLDDTDHLSDRELYARLWHEYLRGETPVNNEIGFNSTLGIMPDGVEPDTSEFLRYYADEDERQRWMKDDPEYEMPAHEDPPYDRDALLPCADYEMPDALAWLRANWSPSAFATNRFGTTQRAIEFVEQLHAAGASGVWIDNVMMLPNHQWTPYADALLVRLPEDPDRRRSLFDVIEQVGKPDELEDRTAGPMPAVWLWWD